MPVAVAIVLILAGGPADASRSSDADGCSSIFVQYETLVEDIAALRRQGHFDQAVGVANRLIRLSEPCAQRYAWLVPEARRHRSFLETVARLSADGRVALARADALEQQMWDCHHRGDTPCEIRSLQEQYAIRRRVLGAADVDTMVSLNSLTSARRSTVPLDESVAGHELAYNQLRAELGARHPLPVGVQQSWAKTLFNAGHYQEAHALFAESLETMRGLYPHGHIEIATALYNLGSACNRIEDFDRAEGLFEEAVTCYQALPDGHVERQYIPLVVAGLAEVYFASFDLNRAESMLRDLLDTYGGQNDALEFIIRFDLALVLKRARRYDEVGHELSRCLPLASDDARLARVLSELANLHYCRGDFDGAVTYGEEAVELHALSSKYERAVSQHELALALAAAGELDRAADLLRSVFEMYVAEYGHEHVGTAKIGTNLVHVLIRQGDLEAAGELLREIAPRPGQVDEVVDMNMAAACMAMSRFQLAQGQLEEARAIEERVAVFLESHPDPVLNIEVDLLLGRIAEKQGRAEDALRYYTSAIVRLEAHRRLSHDLLDRASYFGRLHNRDPYTQANRLLVRQGRFAEAVDIMERGRGRALLDLLNRRDQDACDKASVTSRRSTQLAESNPPEELCRAWRDQSSRAHALRRQLGALRHHADQRLGEAVRAVRQQLFVAESDARTLAARIDALAQPQSTPEAAPLRSTEIRALLNDNEVALIYDFGPHEAFGLMISSDGEFGWELTWHDGSAVTPDAVKAALGMNDARRAPLVSPALTDALLPVEVKRQVDTAGLVYVVADGPLLGVPFESLPLDEDALWLDRYPPVVYGPSCTVMLYSRRAGRAADDEGPMFVGAGNPRLVDTRPYALVPTSGILVAAVAPGGAAGAAGVRMGDVMLSYGSTQVSTFGQLRTAVIAAREAAPAGAVPIVLWRAGHEYTIHLVPTRIGAEFAPQRMPYAWYAHHGQPTATGGQRFLRPLPRAESEVRTIAALFESVGDTHVLVGDESTVTRLSVHASSPRFLHLATHGISEGGMWVRQSGLIMAPEAGSADEQGYLSLADLLNTWQGKLEGTSLVTLSACNSGRGREASADGFLALPWGFLHAGADTVVASLWQVNDTSTELLMNRFYRNLLGSDGPPLPKAAALHEAKRWLRGLSATEVLELRSGDSPVRRAPGLPAPSDNRRGETFSDPYYWAGFVMFGTGTEGTTVR